VRGGWCGFTRGGRQGAVFNRTCLTWLRGTLRCQRYTSVRTTWRGLPVIVRRLRGASRRSRGNGWRQRYASIRTARHGRRQRYTSVRTTWRGLPVVRCRTGRYRRRRQWYNSAWTARRRLPVIVGHFTRRIAWTGSLHGRCQRYTSVRTTWRGLPVIVRRLGGISRCRSRGDSRRFRLLYCCRYRWSLLRGLLGQPDIFRRRRRRRHFNPLWRRDVAGQRSRLAEPPLARKPLVGRAPGHRLLALAEFPLPVELLQRKPKFPE